MTPYQLNVAVQVYNEMKKEEQETLITQSYLIAAWSTRWWGAKKIPKLEKILGVKKPQKKMTSEEMLKQVELLNEAFGGTSV